ncbi:MAG: ABC transporter ATP-binding protein [Oscillospiraceae bacterium]
MSNILKIDNVSKIYKNRNMKINAVNNVSLTIDYGKVLGIIGESGSGKSTLAKMIIGLESITEGNIFFEEKSVRQLLKNDKRYFRKSCQMIFQNPYESFDPLQTIFTSLYNVLKIYQKELNSSQQLEYCKEVLEKYGLVPAKDYLYRYPYELSGGQLQRVAIIRAMLCNPKFLIADEAVSMLDVSVRADIINIFNDIVKEFNTSLLFISHDILTTAYISDYIAVMYLGEVVEYGKTKEIVNNPLHPYTKALISCCGNLSDDIKVNLKYNAENKDIFSLKNIKEKCAFYNRCNFSKQQCRCSKPMLKEVSLEHYVCCFL